MNDSRLSSENLHASCVASDGHAVLISGPSGSGKSDLALRLLDRGFTLVSDDRTIVRKDGSRLIASAPDTIKGKLEIRGVGIVDMEVVPDAPIALPPLTLKSMTSCAPAMGLPSSSFLFLK